MDGLTTLIRRLPRLNKSKSRFNMESVNQLAKKAAGLQPIERIRLVEANPKGQVCS